MKIGTYLHFLRHTVLLRLNPRHRVPLTINVQLTRLCPSTCRYCGQDHKDATRLSLDVLKQILREAKALGTGRVHLSGGEPLMLDDIGEIIEAAKAQGFLVSLATNGMLAKRRVDALKRVDQVMLSLDGPPEIQDALCGEGSAVRLERAVRLFVQEGIPFWTTTVLTRANIPHIDWVVDHARRHKTYANFVLMMTDRKKTSRDHPFAEEVSDLVPTVAETREAIRHLIALKAARAPIGSSMSYLRELLEWPDYRQLLSAYPSRRFQCRAWRSMCELLPNGDLYSCDWTMSHCGGVSVLENGLAAAFRTLPEITECRACALSCYLEANLIFALRPEAVLNWVWRVR